MKTPPQALLEGGTNILQLDRFLETYCSALERLQIACGMGYLEGIYTGQSFLPAANQPERDATFGMAYASDGDLEKHVLIRTDLASTPYFERVFLPRNGRVLILERLDPARPFYFRWISDPDEDLGGTANNRRDMFARAAYSIGSFFLMPSILNSPSFQIIELAPVERD
jgi:hypothetical protein